MSPWNWDASLSLPFPPPLIRCCLSNNAYRQTFPGIAFMLDTGGHHPRKEHTSKARQNHHQNIVLLVSGISSIVLVAVVVNVTTLPTESWLPFKDYWLSVTVVLKIHKYVISPKRTVDNIICTVKFSEGEALCYTNRCIIKN